MIGGLIVVRNNIVATPLAHVISIINALKTQLHEALSSCEKLSSAFVAAITQEPLEDNCAMT